MQSKNKSTAQYCDYWGAEHNLTAVYLYSFQIGGPHFSVKKTLLATYRRGVF